jgi:group II intron reverse transcriptase/maturase
MEQVVERSNLKAALQRVRQNKGSAGADGMTVDQLVPYLIEHWQKVREQLLKGTYQPRPVKRHEIRKRDGGTRMLGIPCVLDRMIQQAILQVLQPIFDPTFSQHSYGFRPGRSAHDAVRAAKRYVGQGRQWVVDVDLEKFFDRVNHDVLMGKLEKRIGDRRLLMLIRRYLKAGMMADGVVTERREGTPQGGPLSPLLANVLLDEVDRELEKRGHAFARYADDCNIYVKSRRAGERVMQALRRLYARLRLRINEAKSAVERPWKRKFLGFSFVNNRAETKLRVASQALSEMKDRVRQITGRSRGRSMRQVVDELGGFLRGWKNYFKLADTPTTLNVLDEWIRHRIRALQLKQWKHPSNIFLELRARGVSVRNARGVAAHAGRWWVAGDFVGITRGLPNAAIERAGIPRLAPKPQPSEPPDA